MDETDYPCPTPQHTHTRKIIGRKLKAVVVVVEEPCNQRKLPGGSKLKLRLQE